MRRGEAERKLALCPRGEVYGLLLSLCFAISAFSAPPKGLTFSGSAYSDLSLYHYGVLENDSAAFGGRSTLSLKAKNVNRRYGKVEGNLDVYFLYGAQAEAVTQARGSMLSVLGESKAPVLLDLRTLYFSVYLPFADVSIGRQIINFGKGFVFSPVDAFSRVDITDLNLRRGGSDVAYVKIPIGVLSGIDVITQFPTGAGDPATAAKAFTSIGSWDLSALGIYRHESKEVLVGGAFKGDLELGVTGELVEHFLGDIKERYFEAMLGVDYSFLSGDLVLLAEYLHSGATRNIQSQWGKHNGFVNAQYSINEIMSISANVIHNFSAEVTLGTLQYFYNILQNVNAIVYVRGYQGSLATYFPLPDLEYSVRLEVKF